MKKNLRFLFEHYEEIILVPGMAIMLLINFANVMARYIFRVSWAPTEELCVICFVYISLIGAAVAVKKRMHLGFALILDSLPPRLKLFANALVSLGIIFLMLLMIYYGMKVCQNQVKFGSATPAMRIPLVYASASVPLCGVTIIVRIIQVYIEEVRGYISSRGQKETEA